MYDRILGLISAALRSERSSSGFSWVLRGEIDRIVNPFIERLRGLVYDSTVGLLRQYQDKAIELLRIEAASFYVKLLQMLRRQVILLVTIVLCLLMIAIGVFALPLAVIYFLPVSPLAKAALVLVFGALYISIPLLSLRSMLSEKRWMQASGSEEFLSKVLNKE